MLIKIRLINFKAHRILQILFNLEDGLVIETVVIPCDRGRTTVCVSSQVGCAMNCQFCYTGRQASIRLDVFSIVLVEVNKNDQIVSFSFNFSGWA